MNNNNDNDNDNDEIPPHFETIITVMENNEWMKTDEFFLLDVAVLRVSWNDACCYTSCVV